MEQIPTITELEPGAAIDPDFTVVETHSSGAEICFVVRSATSTLSLLQPLSPELIDVLSARADIRKELEAGSALHHANLGPKFSFGRSEAAGFYVLSEILEGTSLDAMIRSGSGFLMEQISRVLWETAQALGCVHKAGLIHGNVSPAAILISGSGETKLSSAGMAGLMGLEHCPRSLKAAARPPGYLSPEEISSGNCSAATDIYCLGLLTYEMFAGALPFRGGTKEELIKEIRSARVPSLAVFGPEVPGQIVTFATRATAKEPHKRFLGIDAVLECLTVQPASKTGERTAARRPETPQKRMQLEQMTEGPGTERPVQARAAAGLLWFLPVSLLTTTLSFILAAVGVSAQLRARYGAEYFASERSVQAVRDGIGAIFSGWWPCLVLAQALLTVYFSLKGELPGTGKFIKEQSAAERILRKQPIKRSEIPGYVYFVCGWPIILFFLDSMIGGFLGMVAAGSTLDFYRQTRSLGLAFLLSIVLGVGAFVAFVVFVGALSTG